ncbi:MAG: radical SAM protein [Lachnospiraceae bacterium]|nr:radical SAM protein [Lachnospiraceae bacterium]
MGTYARLRHLWALRQFSDGRLMLMNRKYPMQDYPDEQEAYVLRNCDGNSDFDSLAFLPVHRNILRGLMEKGIVEECSFGETNEPGQMFRIIPSPLLTEIHWAITGYCNMKCPHCFMEAPEGRYGQVSLEQARELIDQFYEAGVLRVSITGGEPLIHPHFREIVKAITEKGMIVNLIVTNGVLIDDDLIDFLKECGHWPEFQISLDGIGTHDLMRGTEGLEESVLRGIQKVIERDHELSVCTLFTKKNRYTAAATYEWLKNRGIKEWLVSRPQKMGAWQGGEDALTTEEIAELCLDLKRRWEADGRPITIGLEKFFNGNAHEPIYSRETIDCYSPESFECPTTQWKIFLLPDGTLLPCTGYTGSFLMEEMPNLYRDRLSEIWKDSALRHFVCRRKKDRLKHIPECSACEHFEKCGAGCGAYAMTENGSPDRPDPFMCALYKYGWRDRFLNSGTAQSENA